MMPGSKPPEVFVVNLGPGARRDRSDDDQRDDHDGRCGQAPAPLHERILCPGPNWSQPDAVRVSTVRVCLPWWIDWRRLESWVSLESSSTRAEAGSSSGCDRVASDRLNVRSGSTEAGHLEAGCETGAVVGWHSRRSRERLRGLEAEPSPRDSVRCRLGLPRTHSTSPCRHRRRPRRAGDRMDLAPVVGQRHVPGFHSPGVRMVPALRTELVYRPECVGHAGADVNRHCCRTGRRRCRPDCPTSVAEPARAPGAQVALSGLTSVNQLSVE